MILQLDRVLMSLIRNLLSLRERYRFHRTKNLQTGNHKTINGEDSDEETGFSELKEIPKELLQIIFSGVNISDRVRLKAVCKSWKDILDDYSFIATPPTLPWMLLPPTQRYDSTLSFFDMVEGKIHKFRNFPKELKGSSYCGSSKGWMLLGKGTIQKPCLYLLNPLSMSFFKLPSVLTIPEAMLESRFGSIVEPFDIFAAFATKIQLSSSDAFSSTVAMIFGYQKEVLAVSKAGIDDSWIIIEHRPEKVRDYLIDIMFSKDGKTLNVLEDEVDKGDIITLTQHTVGCESITVKHISSMSIPDSYPVIHPKWRLYSCYKHVLCQHLVESIHGELLIVTVLVNCLERFSIWNPFEDDMVRQQVGEIRVHLVHENNNGEDAESEQRFNVIGMTTTENESLGDQVLFVAEAGSFSYKAPSNVEGIQNNQIYFIANLIVNTDAYYGVKVFREHGVYSLDQRKFRQCFPSIEYPFHFKPCWFTPTL